MSTHDVFNVSSHLKGENVFLGVEVSFQSGLLEYLLLQLLCNYSLLSSK